MNNAGVVSAKPIVELSDQMVERTLAVNTMAHFFTVKEFLPEMIANKRGHIVTVASMAAFGGIPQLADYAASKSGAFMADESLRHEMNKAGHSNYIKTTCCCPYFINTGMFEGAKDLKFFSMLEPEYVVSRIISGIQ